MIFRTPYIEDNTLTIIHNYKKISDIPGVIVHYDASGLEINTDNAYGTVDNNGSISVWKNQANVNHAIQPLSANQAILNNVNGIKSVGLDGTKYFNFTSTFDLNMCTVIFVMKPAVTVNANMTGQWLMSTDNGTRQTMSGLVFGLCSDVSTGETITLTSWVNPWSNWYFRGSYTKSLGTNDNLASTRISKLTLLNRQGVEYQINGEKINVYDYAPGQQGYLRVTPLLTGENGSFRTVGKLFTAYDNTSSLQGEIYQVIMINRAIETYEMNYIDYIINQKYGI